MVSISDSLLQKQFPPTLKNDWVCLKEKIKNGISQSKIQACKGDNRLINDHSHGSRQCHDESLLQIPVLEIQGSNDALVTGLFAQHLGSALQNHGCIGLGQEHYQRKGETAADQSDPETPSPADDRDEARNPGTNDWSEGRALIGQRNS